MSDLITPTRKIRVPFSRHLEVFSLLFINLMILGHSRSRIIPGGPFFYFSSDILPLLIIFVILHAIFIRNEKNIGDRIFLGVIALAIFSIWTLSIIEAIRFMLLPYARGDWIHW